MSKCRHFFQRNDVHREEEIDVVETIERTIGRGAVVVEDHGIVETKVEARTGTPRFRDSKEAGICFLNITNDLDGLIVVPQALSELFFRYRGSVDRAMIENGKLADQAEHEQRERESSPLHQLSGR